MATVERRPNVAGLVVGLAVVLAGGVAWAAARTSNHGAPLSASVASSPPVAPSSIAVASSTTTTRATPLTSPPTVVEQVGLVGRLATPSGVLLFAHTASPNAVVRIDVDEGRVVVNAVGPVMSTAPAFLAVGPSTAIVRPYDYVPGYVVGDNGVVTNPSGLLGDGTFMICSDGRSDRLWTAGDTLVQVDFNGSPTATIGGAQRPWAIGCDGAGEMLYRQGDTTLVTGDGGPSVVTSNSLIAAGPRTFLVRDCAVATACPLTVVDRATGERRSLTVNVSIATPQALPVQAEGRIGSISPDGRTAVLSRAVREAVLVDLVSGVAHATTTFGGDFQSFVWSADSRYLFYIGASHNLSVFDRQTDEIEALGMANILALASRPS